jgi:flagellum-specific peptidoglycan hydrolase FlgJ
MTGFAFAHGTIDEMTSPTRLPVHLLALKKPATPASTSDSALRSAIVSVATNYLRLAQTRSPAQMEALIWGTDSVDGVDHGESCAAFASLTLALGAQATGQQSWVTGGTTYPWPLHQWADVRVDTNPDSPQIISVMQDAQAHNRWHPLGDAYQPQPGDWVLFDGHVEVVTKYSAGVLYTIGGDSGPNLSVNAHTYPGPLAAQGVTGFVNNGELLSVTHPASGGAGGSGATAASAVSASATRASSARAAATGASSARAAAPGAAAQPATGILALGGGTSQQASAGGAAVPGTLTAVPKSGASRPATSGRAARPTTPAGRGAPATQGTTSVVDTAGMAGSAGSAGMLDMPGLIDGAGMAAGSGTAASGNGVAGSVVMPGSGTAAAMRQPGGSSRPATAVQPRSGRTGAAARASSASPPANSGRAGNPARAGRAGPASGRAPSAVKAPRPGTADIPGLQPLADNPTGGSAAPGTPSHPRNTTPSYTRNTAPVSSSVPGTAAQQAFISQVAPGALAAQSRYGIPAAVTIAQAIDESGWGQSTLAIRDHNLFGIKGTGPAGSDMLPTQEYENGQWVSVSAPFRAYHNVAESIADHGQLLATGQSYQRAMADRHLPDAFATDLTGVYATDPQYGSNLIAIMRLYNLYRYDATTQAALHPAAPSGASSPNGTVNHATAASQNATVSRNGTAIQGGADDQGSGENQGGAEDQGETTPQGAALAQGGNVSQHGTVSHGGVVGQGGSRGRGAGASQNTRANGATASIPGVLDSYTVGPARTAPVGAVAAAAGVVAAGARPGTRSARAGRRRLEPRVAPRAARTAGRASRYVPQIPQSVSTAFITTAKTPLSRAEPLYDDVASRTGIQWELLAACDWMQCQAQPRLSPVYGEKLGTVNADGTVYRTKSAALDQCANELVELAMAVYWIDITARRRLSVRELARVFAAFRWGGLLKLHDISALEFPYSVEGLTAQHTKMRWPDIREPDAPDKPGSRFRQPFGAVPVVLCLGYPAVA